MGHTMVVEVSIQPDDENNDGMWPPVENGAHYDLEDKARVAAARPAALAALAAADALAEDLAGTGWHVEVPPEPA